MRRHARVVGWIAALAIAAPGMAKASPASRAMTRDGYRQAYELRFEEGLAALTEAWRVDPSDPAPPRGVVAITWMGSAKTEKPGSGKWVLGGGETKAQTDQLRGKYRDEKVSPLRATVQAKKNIVEAFVLD